MLSGCWSMLSIYLVLANVLFSGVAAQDGPVNIKIGNNTIERTVQLRTHSMHPPYIDQDLQNRWWDFGADAYVNTMKHVRLTQNKPSQVGWLWSRLALTAANWVIEVEFKVSGDNSHLYGDGLAMWLTSDRAQTGSAFGNKENFNGLGILLDTYSNSRHSYAFPRISGVRLDGSVPFDHGSDGDKQVLGACSANFRRTNVATKLKVTYVKKEFLDVKIQYKAFDEFTDCFQLRNVELPPNPFIGFSAATGQVSDNHDIVSITTYSAILSPPDMPRNQMKKGWGLSGKSTSSEESSGTWLGLLFKLALFGGVCAGGWFGYKEYQRRQRFGIGNFSDAPGSARSYASGPPSAMSYASGGPSSAGYAPSSAGAYTPTTGGAYTPNSGGAYTPMSGYSGFGGPPSAAGSPYAGPPTGGSSYLQPNSAYAGPPSGSSWRSGPGSPAYSDYGDSKRQ
ncbi:lectin [Coprinopsis sp. MPI-PUGE-AT-0042]|nr:lectin [Coprinopsis sp. MPI-PUGE-AT-0042]